jgi:hypothetical protein
MFGEDTRFSKALLDNPAAGEAGEGMTLGSSWINLV